MVEQIRHLDFVRRRRLSATSRLRQGGCHEHQILGIPNKRVRFSTTDRMPLDSILESISCPVSLSRGGKTEGGRTALRHLDTGDSQGPRSERFREASGRGA